MRKIDVQVYSALSGGFVVALESGKGEEVCDGGAAGTGDVG